MLIRAGRALFSERGLYEARIEDLADRADVAKGTVYLYFQGKEGLIEAVVSEGLSALEDRVRSATAGTADLADHLERVVRAHFQFFAENPDLMRIFHQARGMLAFGRAKWRPLRAPLSRHVAFLAADIARFRAGSARPSPADRELASAMFGCVSGIASMRVALGADPVPSQAAVLAEALARMGARVSLRTGSKTYST
jgi:AcrR family transcriptional regulator